MGAPALAEPGLTLGLRQIVKYYGLFPALGGVDFEAASGEVHALLGENGAGKTTLMNVVGGIIPADSGDMTVRGEPVTFHSPRDAFNRGIGIVHQHFRLIEKFTVAENVHVGWEATPLFVSDTGLERATAELAAKFALEVDPAAQIWQLSTGERQRVAILRALARGAEILILDEPTATLSPSETAELFAAIDRIRAAGHTVIFISHKLNEVLEIADRITVLRGGRNVASGLAKSGCDKDMLARLMVGGGVEEVRPSDGAVRGAQPVALTLEGVCADDDFGRRALHDVSLELCKGEIVGVAGVSGNGQRELAEVIVGLRRATAGSIRVEDRDLTGAPPIEAVRAGVGYIPEDLGSGLALEASVETNAAIKASHDRPLRRGPWLTRRALRAFSADLLGKAGLSRIATARPASTLSGGQAQRLVAHREMLAARVGLVAVHPTRGLDVAAAAGVHELLLKARADGIAVLMISEDLDEVLQLTDRIVVLYEGRIMGSFSRADVSRDTIGALMGGASANGNGNSPESRA
ncbi:MAG: ral nucleoside transport system ATP-binding protein [Thermoleophilaceae bacterium]|jgi:simple sugar transport system ATP-binding protein|nr:ral nucleoside transport system ATP-binding protein [Thermoleophilaceae bacterium]